MAGMGGNYGNYQAQQKVANAGSRNQFQDPLMAKYGVHKSGGFLQSGAGGSSGMRDYQKALSRQKWVDDQEWKKTQASYGGGGGYGGGSGGAPMYGGGGGGGGGGGLQRAAGGGFGGGGGGGLGASGMIDSLSGAGAGLLDPTSAYAKRMRNEISEGIGQRTQAQQRGAGLRSAQAGMGYGASPELLETHGEIGREGLRAQGQADAGAVLGGMQLGGSLLSPALSGEIGLQGQALSGFMGGQQLEQNQRLQDQSLDAQAKMRGRDLDVQSQLQQQALEQERYLREMAMMGSYGGGY